MGRRATILLCLSTLAAACSGGGSGPVDLEPGPILGACLLEPHYIGQMPLNRWRNFPLRTFVKEATFPAENRAQAIALILAGLRQWAEETDGRIGSITTAPDEVTADLVVEARDLGDVGSAVTTHGTGTPYLARGRIIFDGETVATLVTPQNGAFLSALAAHEMGHLLGIIGHPTTEGVLMNSPLQALRPTPADVNTISHAYCTTKGALATMQGVQPISAPQ